jgi:glycosyltransferase involved in cell wall biosynthesis
VKVAVVTSFPQDPAVPIGGVEAVSVNLVGALSMLYDMDLHVVTLDSRIAHNQVTTWGKAVVHRLRCVQRSTLLNTLTIGRRLVNAYLVRLSPDVVHVHDTYGLMLKGFPAPRVFTVHGFIYSDTRISGGRLPRLRAALWKFFEIRGWADQPHIISISPYVRERLSGIVKSCIHDIENPIAESFFSLERRERKGVIFSAAAISQRKNTLALIDAVALLIKEGIYVLLRLAGKIVDAGYGRAVNDRIDAYGLRRNVTLLGPIGTEQVKDELAQASVFALLSLEENAPLGVEEAMAAGVPVVASNRCGMPYMVRNHETGFLVDPFNSKIIAQRFRELLTNNMLRIRMGKRSREIARELYHPRRIAKRTATVYQEAIATFKLKTHHN